MGSELKETGPERSMPSREHEQFVSALSGGGAVLTPTVAPTAGELRLIREAEVDAALPVAVGVTSSFERHGDVYCLVVDPNGTNRTAINFHGGGYLEHRTSYTCGR